MQLETKNIAKEVRERNNVEDSSHTKTLHSRVLHPHYCECFHANQTTASLLITHRLSGDHFDNWLITLSHSVNTQVNS